MELLESMKEGLEFETSLQGPKLRSNARNLVTCQELASCLARKRLVMYCRSSEAHADGTRGKHLRKLNKGRKNSGGPAVLHQHAFVFSGTA